MTTQKQKVALATEESTAGRRIPADIDDIDLNEIEIPYRTAFSTAISRVERREGIANKRRSI